MGYIDGLNYLLYIKYKKNMFFFYFQPFNYYDDIHMNHGSDVTAASSHSSEFEEERRLKPEVKFIYYYV